MTAAKVCSLQPSSVDWTIVHSYVAELDFARLIPLNNFAFAPWITYLSLETADRLFTAVHSAF